MPPPGPPGPPGIFPGLTESDIQRIAAWPGVKGDKGDTGDCQREQQKGDDDEVVLLNGQQQKLRVKFCIKLDLLIFSGITAI